MKTFEHIDLNDRERVFFVGDIHGDSKLFEHAVNFLGLSEKDYLVCTGDLIDRGEASVDVLTRVLMSTNMTSVLGNHDHFMVKAMNNRKMSNFALWYQNGGYWAEQHDRAFVQGLANAVEEQFPLALIVWYKDTKVLVTHAEVPTGDLKVLERKLTPITGSVKSDEDLARLVAQQKLREEIMWGRNRIYEGEQFVSGVDLTIHGHTVTQCVREDEEPLPLQLGNQHWIDTGACFTGGRLTIAELVDGELQYTQFWFDSDNELCIV